MFNVFISSTSACASLCIHCRRPAGRARHRPSPCPAAWASSRAPAGSCGTRVNADTKHPAFLPRHPAPLYHPPPQRIISRLHVHSLQTEARATCPVTTSCERLRDSAFSNGTSTNLCFLLVQLLKTMQNGTSDVILKAAINTGNLLASPSANLKCPQKQTMSFISWRTEPSELCCCEQNTSNTCLWPLKLGLQQCLEPSALAKWRSCQTTPPDTISAILTVH